MCMGFDQAEMAAYATSAGNQLVLFDISAFDYRDLAKIGPGLLLVDTFDHRWEYVTNMGNEVWLRTDWRAKVGDPLSPVLYIALPCPALPCPYPL